MIYWEKGRADKRESFKLPPLTGKYMTFEGDPGGFNNVRIAFEYVVRSAAMAGRTLVNINHGTQICELRLSHEYSAQKQYSSNQLPIKIYTQVIPTACKFYLLDYAGDWALNDKSNFEEFFVIFFFVSFTQPSNQPSPQK